MPKLFQKLEGDAIRLSLREGEKEVAKALLNPRDDGGMALERLSVPDGERGKGFARTLLREVKRLKLAKALYLRPRPFGDMAMNLDALQRFYESEGFQTIDAKDTMKLKTAEAGWQPDDRGPQWHYPDPRQQAHAAALGRMTRLPAAAAKGPKHLMASLMVSSLLGDQKLASITVRAFQDELEKISRG